MSKLQKIQKSEKDEGWARQVQVNPDMQTKVISLNAGIGYYFNNIFFQLPG